MALVKVDDRSDLVDALNRIYHRDKGSTGYGDTVVWNHTTSSYLLDADNPSGNHAKFGGTVLTITDTRVGLGVDARLANAKWLLARNAGDSADINLIRASASDIIELGASGSRWSPLSPITNNTPLSFRNAANNATVDALKLNASDYFEFGAAATRVTISSPLTNNTKLTGRNAANSASVDLIGLNNSDQVDVGVLGTRTNLLGTVVAPGIDPPTVDGQVTAESQTKAFAYVTVSGGAVTLHNAKNIQSVTYNAAGNFTVAWDRDFASANYVCLPGVEDNGAAGLSAKVNSKVAGSADIHVFNAASTLTDPDAFVVACWGTLS